MIEPNQSSDHFNIERGKSAVACVDVLVAARDRGDTIERAVASALAQDEVRAVIVVDDGSTDDTTARARRCDPEGKRLIIERLSSSVGPAAARNIAIEISTAPWLTILDATTFFFVDELARCYQSRVIVILSLTSWRMFPEHSVAYEYVSHYVRRICQGEASQF